jgi:hypothetical protein
LAAVVFRIGDERTGLSAGEALDLAELVGRQRAVAAQNLAGRIRGQAALDPNRDEVSDDIVLELNDQLVIASVLNSAGWPGEEPAFARLQTLVIAALANG